MLFFYYVCRQISSELREVQLELETKLERLSNLLRNEDDCVNAIWALREARSPFSPPSKASVAAAITVLAEGLLGGFLGINRSVSGDLAWILAVLPAMAFLLVFLMPNDEDSEKNRQLAVQDFEDKVAELCDEINALGIEIAILKSTLISVEVADFESILAASLENLAL